MRTNIVLDDELVAEALSLTGAKTKRELVHLAILELVRSRKRKNLLDLAGRIEFRDDFDHKKARELRDGSALILQYGSRYCATRAAPRPNAYGHG